ncbi:MAG: hypothetical protein Q8O25_08295 [Sulfurisoma sp.]|nr:hypothetical protein [Sulfurisoma sp.]
MKKVAATPVAKSFANVLGKHLADAAAQLPRNRLAPCRADIERALSADIPLSKIAGMLTEAGEKVTADQLRDALAAWKVPHRVANQETRHVN